MHSLEVCTPWQSPATRTGPRATRKFSNRSSDEQRMLYSYSWPCFMAYTRMYFIQSLLLDIPHLPHTNAKPKPWRRNTRQRESQQNFTYYLISLSSAKLIWICYYSRLLAYLSGIFPLTIQLGESLNKISSPNPRRGTYSVLINLPVRSLYLWCEWNRSYHPNSL